MRQFDEQPSSDTASGQASRNETASHHGGAGPASEPAESNVWAEGERILAGLDRRRPLPAPLIRELAEAVRQAKAEEAATRFASGTDTTPHERKLAVWQAIHRYVYATPYRDRQRLKRSEQWREVLPRVRDLGEPELVDWVVLQAEVASNRERGIPDMRPRKAGPSFIVLLEHVVGRMRKARAILEWMRAADAEGCWIVDAAFHAETKRILLKYGLSDLDESGQILPCDEPLART
jgi:hypothetical protein